MLGRIFLNHSFGSDFCVLPKRACQELKCPAWWVPDAVPSDEEAALTARWFSWLTALSGRHSEQGGEQRRHIPYLLHLLFTNEDQHKGAATLFPEVGGRKPHPSPGEVPQKGWVSLAYKLTWGHWNCAGCCLHTQEGICSGSLVMIKPSLYSSRYSRNGQWLPDYGLGRKNIKVMW